MTTPMNCPACGAEMIVRGEWVRHPDCSCLALSVHLLIDEWNSLVSRIRANVVREFVEKVNDRYSWVDVLESTTPEKAVKVLYGVIAAVAKEYGA